MGFDQFLGNQRIVSAIRNMLGRDRVPGALLFTGPRGTGKFTLARMFAQAANCERLRDDFCGECNTCQRIAGLADIEGMVARGLAERGESADAATVDRIPLILQTHQDVWAIVPDPVRLRTPVARPLIRAGQLRAIQRAGNFMPQARRRIFLIDGADTIRWAEADILLKALEEAPPTTTFVLVATRPDAMPSTIRSRCIAFHFAPVPQDGVARLLKDRRGLSRADAEIIAQLSEGSPGIALDIDLAQSRQLRGDALAFLSKAGQGRNFAAVFAASAQLVKNEQGSFENKLEVFYSLLTDLLAILLAPKNGPLRNPDLRPGLEELGKKLNAGWVLRAVEDLDRLESGLHRNIGRQLGLDAWAVTLASAAGREE
jgi:DNA polymerase-3 subunit delta'